MRRAPRPRAWVGVTVAVTRVSVGNQVGVIVVVVAPTGRGTGLWCQQVPPSFDQALGSGGELLVVARFPPQLIDMLPQSRILQIIS